uniref:C2H2-type domain-containing protein n=1 Tax=Neogobius melanostomus TaxID=47308 RepID=A0A8C6U963_9GOBI
DEPDIKQEPEEFPFHMVTVKAEDDDDESPVLHLRPTEGEECGSGADSQEHSDSSDTDCSEDYSHPQAPAKRSYAMIPPDSSVPDSRPFICSDCGKGFKDKFVLQRHVLYVHRGERPHECSVCGKSFKTKTVLKDHVKIHTGERSHICPVCEKGFIKKFDLSQEVGLNEHLKTHVDEGTLDNCPDCGMSFRFNSQLQMHLSHHKKERPHKCSVCEKTFTQKSTLKDHMKIHTGDKSFGCSFCKKCFVKKSDLTRHQIFVHYVCPVCSKHGRLLLVDVVVTFIWLVLAHEFNLG